MAFYHYHFMSSTLIYISLFSGLYFQIFMLVTFIEGLIKEKENKGKFLAKTENEELPSVTIIVPCFNEEKTVIGTLKSLMQLNYPKNKFSVFFVDDGSRDNTYEQVKKFAVKYTGRISVMQQKNQGKHVAVNNAIKAINSEIVGCLDADSYVSPDALLKMIPYFKDQKVMAVTPAMKVFKPNSILERMQKAEYDIGIFFKKIFGDLNAIHVTPGPFSLFRRRVFDQIGLFKKAHNTEDMEIAFRIQSHKGLIKNCPNAYVYTVPPKTIKKLYVQRTRWVYGFINNCIDYRHIFFNKEYGHMGMLTLPISALSIALAILLFGNTLFETTKNTYRAIATWYNAGAEIPTWSQIVHHFNFDLFFINTSAFMFLAMLLLAMMIAIFLISKKMSDGKMRPTIDMVYFALIYSWLAPLWIMKAVYNTMFRKATPWR